MSFCTSIHCMDGRIQEPIIEYLKKKCNAKYVDTITEPGPIKILAENDNKAVIDSIHYRISISVDKHGSQMIAISGHHDCAGNPVPKDTQIEQIIEDEKILKEKYPDVKIIKFYVNENWQVEEL
jgi:hypothetical protein